MSSQCYNCDYNGEMDWHWLVVSLIDDNETFATSSLSHEYFNHPDFELIEINHCPKCNSEQ